MVDFLRLPDGSLLAAHRSLLPLSIFLVLRSELNGDP